MKTPSDAGGAFVGTERRLRAFPRRDSTVDSQARDPQGPKHHSQREIIAEAWQIIYEIEELRRYRQKQGRR